MQLDRLPADLRVLLVEFAEACAQPGSAGKQRRIGAATKEAVPAFAAWHREGRQMEPVAVDFVVEPVAVDFVVEPVAVAAPPEAELPPGPIDHLET